MARRPRLPGLPRRRRMKRSDSLLGMLVFILASLIFTYCGSDNNTTRPLHPQPEDEQPVLISQADGEAQSPKTTPGEEPDDTDIPRAGTPVRFLMHNVANYFVAGERQRSRYVLKPKSQQAKEAVAELIDHARPEIVGLIEIGGPMALDDLRSRLAARGLNYPHYRVLTREGDDRALAILSRHPIVQDNSRANVPLCGSQRQRMLRGILDVTIRMEDGRLFRIIGAHLKSRVSSDPAAAEARRTKEAHTLAMHIQQAIRLQPNMPILVYGDWNDGPADTSVAILRQGLSQDAALTRLKPRDSRGETWTIYYDGDNSYNAFDQIYVNKVLNRRMGRKGKEAAGIIDIPAAAKASDHRALWCELK